MEIAWKDRGPPTTLEPPEAARVLVTAYQAEKGRAPPLELAELELAHVFIETNGTRSMWRNNWGNISAGGFTSSGVERIVWPGDFWRPSWFELEDGASEKLRALHERMLAGKAPSAFRAPPDQVSGARGYVRFTTTGRFAPMAAAGARGDVQGYARAVYDTGYCRDRACRPENLAPRLRELVAGFRRDRIFQGLGLSRARRSAPGDGFGVVLALALATRYGGKSWS